MPVNYDGQWEVRISYQVPISSNVLTHRYTIDVNLDADPSVGDTFDEIPVNKHNSTLSTLDVEVDALVALIRPFFSSSVDFSLAELWRYPTDGFDAVFYAVYELGVQGSHASAAIAAQQGTLTYRTLGGGIMRQQFMEMSSSGDGIASYPFSAGIVKTISDYMITTDHGWVGRDNTRPVVPFRFSSGANEKLWRKRFRI